MDAIATIADVLFGTSALAPETEARLIVTALEKAGFVVVPRIATEAMIEGAPRSICRVADIWSEMVKAAVAETN